MSANARKNSKAAKPVERVHIGFMRSPNVPHARQLAFRYESAPVLEIFSSCLERHGCRLAGNSEVYLFLGERGSEPKYAGKTHQGARFAYYYDQAFDVQGYFAAAKSDRPEHVVALVERTLLEIAALLDADPAPIRHAAAATRASGYDTFVPARWLQPVKVGRAGAVAALVAHVALGTQEWAVEVRDAGGALLERRMIPERAWRNKAPGDVFCRLACAAGILVLSDRAGKATFRLDVAKGLGATLPRPASGAKRPAGKRTRG